MSSEVTNTSPNFNDLGLSEPILRAINDAGYTTPTPIQAQGIPLVLTGGDLLAGAQTGTGKTAGFTLPILHILSQKPVADLGKGRPRCLMLTPTRELAAQIEESVKTYGKYLSLTSTVIFGGVNINPQMSRLRKPLDILVATPGRLLDLANQKAVDLSGVEILVQFILDLYNIQLFYLCLHLVLWPAFSILSNFVLLYFSFLYEI